MIQLTTLLTVAATESEGGIESLGINPVAILLQTGTFLILFFIIRRYALDKIVDGLDERRKKIENSLKDAEELEKRNASAQEETAKMLKGARSDADNIIGKAHEEAGIMIKEAEESASKKADKIVADASAKLESDVAKARVELKKDVLELVGQATETIIGEKLDEKKDHQLIEKMLEGDS